MQPFFKVASMAIIAAAMMLNAASVHAALLGYTVTGDVIFGDESGLNAFGLSAGDTITATGVFDDSVLTAGSGDVSFGLGSGNTMTIYVGAETFHASDDISYGGGLYPLLVFNNFSLDEFNFSATSPEAFNSNFMSFDDIGGDYGDLYGEWRADVPTAAVPEPMSAAVVGTALVGLLAMRRKMA